MLRASNPNRSQKSSRTRPGPARNCQDAASQHPAAEIAYAVEPFPPKLPTPPALVPTGPVEAESSYAQTGKLPDREDFRFRDQEESHQARDRRGDRGKYSGHRTTGPHFRSARRRPP